MTEIGHNNPPPYDVEVHADLEKQIAELNDVAADWLKLETIEDDTQSGKLTDVINAARQIAKSVEERRKSEKAPWQERARTVDEAFKRLHGRVDKINTSLKAMQGAYLRQKEERQRQEQRKREEAARREREEAERKAREAASRLDTAGMADAEAELEKARKAEERAAKPQRTTSKSHTGGGRTMSLQTVRYAEVRSVLAVATHYRSHPDLIACLERLATADVRSKDVDETKIPGIEILSKEVAR